MTKLSLEEARILYVRTGHCKHEPEFYVVSKPPNCGVKLTDCGVCSERITLIYLN